MTIINYFMSKSQDGTDWRKAFVFTRLEVVLLDLHPVLLSPRGHGHDFGDYIVYNALLMHFNVQIIILSVRRRAIIKIQISQFFVSLKHFKFPNTPTPPLLDLRKYL